MDGGATKMTIMVMADCIRRAARMSAAPGRGGPSMRRASIAALKARLSECVDAAKAGEEVIVTDRNKPVARLGLVVLDRRLHEAARLEGLTAWP